MEEFLTDAEYINNGMIQGGIKPAVIMVLMSWPQWVPVHSYPASVEYFKGELGCLFDPEHKRCAVRLSINYQGGGNEGNPYTTSSTIN